MSALKVTIRTAVIVVIAVTTPEAQTQCVAPTTWFPHATTPEPDFHAPQSNCEFHQWGWQTFLWLTQPTSDNRIRLLDLPTAGELFMPGKGPATMNATTLERLKKQKLVLSPRTVKREGATGFGSIRQAFSEGVLVDAKGRPLYYASHVSREFYQFVRTNRLFVKAEYVKADPKTNFPVRSLELKSSWRVLDKGEKADGFFTTTAEIHPVVCRNGGNNCTKDDVVVDLSRTETVTVALVGLHVVGVVEDHPEFIWSTFEHKDNAPDLPDGTPANSPNPVSDRDWTFYKKNTAAKDCNVLNKNTLAFDATTKQLAPTTQVFRQFAFGADPADPTAAADTANVKSLNESVHKQLKADSVWKNYFLVGGVWFNRANGLEPNLTGPAMQQRVVGSTRLSNATMETFTQQLRKNCFACHNTGAKDLPNVGNLPPMNMNLSHILTDGLLQREQALKAEKKLLRAKEDAPLKSYAEVQKLLNDFIKQDPKDPSDDIPIQFAPHGDFWNTMDYKQFTEGDIPGVTSGGQPLKVLVRKDSKKSNLIMSLRGTPGTIFDPENGTIGRMPPSGPFMSDEDIDRLAKWIDDDCPNENKKK